MVAEVVSGVADDRPSDQRSHGLGGIAALSELLSRWPVPLVAVLIVALPVMIS